MQEYVIELSKYFIALFMVLYTGSCFYTFRYPVGEYSKGIFILQNILMFLVQVLCFLDLSLTGGDLQYLFFFAFILIFLFATITMVSLIYENINRLLLNNMCMLLGIGLCMVSRLSFDKAIRQYVIVLVSLIMSLFIPFCLAEFTFSKNHLVIRNTGNWSAQYGIDSRRGNPWVQNIFYHGRNYISAFGICEDPVPFLPGGCIMGKCVLSAGVTDCCDCRSSCSCPGRIQGSGKCADLFHWFCIRCFCRNENYLYLAAGMIGGGAASYLAYLLFDHVRVRVLAWQDPWKYIDSKGYQITQSLFAIGSGSWFGMGLLKGNPTAIPYVEADFIFHPFVRNWELSLECA